MSNQDTGGPHERPPRNADELDGLLAKWRDAQSRGKADQCMMARRVIPAMEIALRAAWFTTTSLGDALRGAVRQAAAAPPPTAKPSGAGGKPVVEEPIAARSDAARPAGRPPGPPDPPPTFPKQYA